MCEKIFPGLLLVCFQRSLVGRLKASLGGSCGYGWRRRGGHDK